MDHHSLREGLLRLAANHRWTWKFSARSLLDSLPGSAPGRHPFEVASQMSQSELEEYASNGDHVSALSAELADLEAIVRDAPAPRIAYCSPEFGITARLPQYSGGLGVLAGDHLKAASDAKLPLVGVGLFYREGFFRQFIEDGGQAERYVVQDPALIGARDTGQVVTVPMPGREVSAKIWVLEVGRVHLVLLDTDVEGNGAEDRAITDRLYGGDRRHRLEQEMVLGVGGSRALEALGMEISVFHLNEGHAGFLTLDLMDRVMNGGSLAEAIESVRSSLVFTTHTPVPAGIDRFHADLITPYLALWAERWGTDLAQVWELGADPEHADSFNMAALALRLCRQANGVSQLHGEVSRNLFSGVGMGDSITHVTNGVHARTWVSEEGQSVFDEVAGTSWDSGDVDAWQRIAQLDGERIKAIKDANVAHLADLVGAATGHKLRPDSLVIGFARRFAPYKRAALLFEQEDALTDLLDDQDRPVHFLYAGKAHPMDEPGKELISKIVDFAERRGAGGGFTFIPGYDMDIARALVAGCDIWLNTPIRPREASGTSGQKAALNGGLNCSILDGWWAEMFESDNGWAIPETDDAETRDQAEARATLSLLEEIALLYHQRPEEFIARIRSSWRTLGPRVTAARMLRDYEETVYLT